MVRQQGYLIEKGIVYENGDWISKGPILEMTRRIQSLMEQANYKEVYNLIVNGDFKKLSDEEQLTIFTVVLPQFIGVDIAEVIGDIEAECYYLTQDQQMPWNDEEEAFYQDNLPKWVKSAMKE